MLMRTKTVVWCQCQFEGFHCWPEAPESVGFLRDPHRHIFHVKVTWEVLHDDRDIEFIAAKRWVLDVIQQIVDENNVRTWSCEHWAGCLLEELKACEVTVSEDGENGATVTGEFK